MQWKKGTHEARVEKFYGSGIDGYHEYHDGYLNFGYWENDPKTYEEAAQNLIRMLGNALGLDRKSKLLDVGCGMGTQDTFLAYEFMPDCIDALDVTEKHIVRAKERARRQNISTNMLRFHHGTATDLPFPDEHFTHILSVEAPEHFDTREDFFDEAFRVLKPGGVMAIADYSLARNPETIFERFLVELARRTWHVPKANVYGNDVFQEILEDIGFANVSIKNVGALTIPGYYPQHRTRESICEMFKQRGLLKGLFGICVVDWAVYTAYRMGLCEYIILRAEKPKEKTSESEVFMFMRTLGAPNDPKFR